MTDLPTLASRLLSTGPHKTEPSPRLIRVLLNGAYIFSTTSSHLVWEHPYYPQYYLPSTSLTSSGHLTNAHSGGLDAYTVYDVQSGSVVKPKAAVVYHEAPLKDLVRLDFKAMDGLFEEDDPIDGHPADPYKRIDTRRSSRPIRVEVDGTVVAEASWAVHLYETGLPVRYYLPHTAAKWEFLRESKTETFCPYKGLASYFDVEVGGEVKKDLVWWYPNARMESLSVQNLLCFYNEKVDITLDGEKLERPKTHFA